MSSAQRSVRELYRMFGWGRSSAHIYSGKDIYLCRKEKRPLCGSRAASCASECVWAYVEVNTFRGSSYSGVVVEQDCGLLLLWYVSESFVSLIYIKIQISKYQCLFCHPRSSRIPLRKTPCGDLKVTRLTFWILWSSPDIQQKCDRTAATDGWTLRWANTVAVRDKQQRRFHPWKKKRHVKKMIRLRRWNILFFQRMKNSVIVWKVGWSF